MPRYTICPYYVDDNKKTVSCEDVIRRFVTYRSKNKHMNRYCDKDWQDCPYASSLSAMYQRIEEGASEEQEKLIHSAMALEKENKKLISLLGRYDIRIETKDAEIQQLRTKIRNMEESLHQEFRRRKAAENRVKELEHGKASK